MSITEERLAEIRGRLAALRPGYCQTDWYEGDDGPYCEIVADEPWGAHFAHAPEDIADLVAEVTALRKVATAAEAQVAAADAVDFGALNTTQDDLRAAVREWRAER